MDELRLATPTHQKAVDLVTELLWQRPSVLALALAGSAARNEGSFDSDLDFMIFFAEDAPVTEILAQVGDAFEREIVASKRTDVGIFFGIDLDVAPIPIIPQPRGWTDGPDAYELEIGNTYIYPRLIFEHDNYFTQAQAAYLPYYDEALRTQRLAQTLDFCLNNIDHIKPFVQRGLYFQAFRRLYDASREFLQALFITRRTYPIAYDKWVKKQLVEILELPDLYREFVTFYEVHKLESDELVAKGEQLRELVVRYTGD